MVMVMEFLYLTMILMILAVLMLQVFLLVLVVTIIFSFLISLFYFGRFALSLISQILLLLLQAGALLMLLKFVQNFLVVMVFVVTLHYCSHEKKNFLLKF